MKEINHNHFFTFEECVVKMKKKHLDKNHIQSCGQSENSVFLKDQQITDRNSLSFAIL